LCELIQGAVVVNLAWRLERAAEEAPDHVAPIDGCGLNQAT
jgi:hypothetical protein